MLLIDKNLPKKITILREDFPGITHVDNVALGEADDNEVWLYAQKNQLHILTKDADFIEIQSLRGFPPKIVWIRCGNASTNYIIGLLQKYYKEIMDFIKNEALGNLEIR